VICSSDIFGNHLKKSRRFGIERESWYDSVGGRRGGHCRGRIFVVARFDVGQRRTSCSSFEREEFQRKGRRKLRRFQEFRSATEDEIANVRSDVEIYVLLFLRVPSRLR